MEQILEEPRVQPQDLEPILHPLLEIEKTEQKLGIDIGSIYIIRRNPNNPSQVDILLDTSQMQRRGIYTLQTLYWPEANTNGILDHIDQHWVTDHFITDTWGTWLTGIAPIHNSHGQYVATLAVDVAKSSISTSMHHLLYLAMATAIPIFLIGCIASFFLAFFLTRPLHQITLTIEQIEKGNLTSRVA
ncbi:MAG: hypothetical protein HY069_00220, partial [Chlamydiia bacterium]|nr:hypothetical protein [Chlamydiia bacterium]